MTIKDKFKAAAPDIKKLEKETVFVTISLRGLDRSVEVAMLNDLREVCLVEERRAFGLSYECTTDKLSKVSRVLAGYEKHGLDITHVRTGAEHVYTARMWRGSRRTLSTGQIQITRRGRILTYANRAELKADSPLYDSMTFENFNTRRVGGANNAIHAI
jgi:hypothetical protein